jgi:hypothetical protein
LGGSSDAGDLRDLVIVVGDRDEVTWAESRGYDGGRSRSSSIRRIPILDSGRLRTLPDGAAMLLLRSLPPAVIRMRQWTQRNRNTVDKATTTHSLDCSTETDTYNPHNIANCSRSDHYGQTSIASGEVTKR